MLHREFPDIRAVLIANMGKGKHISMETLTKICETLNCGILDVIELEQEKDLHAPYHYRMTQLKIQEEGSGRMIKYDRLWDTLKEKGISQYKLIKDYGIDNTG